VTASEVVEEVWFGDDFKHLELAKRSSKVLLRRVEAHSRVATELIRNRDPRSVGSSSDASVLPKSAVRLAAARARARASKALDDLFTANSEPTGFKTKVAKPRDIRDAVTALVGAYSVVGDTERIRALIERMSGVGVEPDQHVFNALLRSEASAKIVSVGEETREARDGSYESCDALFGISDDPDSARSSPTSGLGDDDARAAVIRVETMMRDMIESGVEPDLHSFMALLAAYARAGDVAAAADALTGMLERDIPIDVWAYNLLLQACAAGGDLDASRRIRAQMISQDVNPDAITFLHLFRACARRSRQVAAVLRDQDDWDDWDDWGGAGFGDFGGGASETSEKESPTRARASTSHARLTGALVDQHAARNVTGVGDVARAAAQAAREGLSSVADVFSRGVDGLAGTEAASALREYGATGGGDGGSRGAAGTRAGFVGMHRNAHHENETSPELTRAREAFVAFRDDMHSSGVAYTRRSATAAMQALGSLREFEAMMSFLRNPPVEPDAYMYTQALHLLAQDPFHWRREKAIGTGDSRDVVGETRKRYEHTGPLAALTLFDEMAGKNIRATRVTLNCVLLACAQLRDYPEATRRFEDHLRQGGEIGIDTFNCLFKAAWSSGVFASEAFRIADGVEGRSASPAARSAGAFTPNAFTEMTLRRIAASSAGDAAYTPERSVANDLLVRFGFDPELEMEQTWAPMAEREEAASRAKNAAANGSADDEPEFDRGNEGTRGEDAEGKKQPRRWNRDREINARVKTF